MILRPYTPSTDFETLVELRQRVEQEDQQGIDVSPQAIAHQLQIPGHIPEQDRWVVEGQNALLACGWIWHVPESNTAQLQVITTPSHRRQGLANAILPKLIARAQERNVTQIVSYARGHDPAAEALAQKHKFAFDWLYLEMRSFSLPPTWLTPLPKGYTIHPYITLNDLPLLTYAMNTAYAGQPGHQEAAQEQMAAWLPEFSPESLLLLFSPQQEVCGICRCEVSAERSKRNNQPTGYIDAPGIFVEHRSLELYQALLSAAIQWLHAKECLIAEMESWGEPDERINCYQQRGFQIIRSIQAYSLSMVKS